MPMPLTISRTPHNTVSVAGKGTPTSLDTVRGARICAIPIPMLSQPSPRASCSGVPADRILRRAPYLAMFTPCSHSMFQHARATPVPRQSSVP
jgi:hypothetical protein